MCGRLACGRDEWRGAPCCGARVATDDRWQPCPGAPCARPTRARRARRRGNPTTNRSRSPPASTVMNASSAGHDVDLRSRSFSARPISNHGRSCSSRWATPKRTWRVPPTLTLTSVATHLTPLATWCLTGQTSMPVRGRYPWSNLPRLPLLASPSRLHGWETTPPRMRALRAISLLANARASSLTSAWRSAQHFDLPPRPTCRSPRSGAVLSDFAGRRCAAMRASPSEPDVRLFDPSGSSKPLSCQHAPPDVEPPKLTRYATVCLSPGTQLSPSSVRGGTRVIAWTTCNPVGRDTPPTSRPSMQTQAQHRSCEALTWILVGSRSLCCLVLTSVARWEEYPVASDTWRLFGGLCECPVPVAARGCQCRSAPFLPFPPPP